MTFLIAGLALFLGLHSIRIFADDWRSRMIAAVGEKPWKAGYSLLSLAGFALIVYGYGQARAGSMILWHPPLWMWTVTSLLTLPAFVLIVAGNMKGTRIKAKLGHPMLAGTKVGAFAHLIATAHLAGLVLFGSFLAWSIADYTSARRRDRAAGVVYSPGTASRDAIAIVIGIIAWAAFAWWLHGPLIGLRPFG
jgi:uncharacterized membrane protein